MPPVAIGRFCFNVMQDGRGLWYVAGRLESHQALDLAKAQAQSIFDRMVSGCLEQ